MNPLGHRHILTRHYLLLCIPHGTQPVEQARKMYFNIKKTMLFGTLENGVERNVINVILINVEKCLSLPNMGFATESCIVWPLGRAFNS